MLLPVSNCIDILTAVPSAFCFVLRLSLLQSPAYSFSDSKECLLWSRYFFPFLSTDFRRPWYDFRETLPHDDAVCPEIVYLLYRGIHMCPLKTEGRKPPIFAHMSTQNRHFQLRHSLVRENRKIYNNRVNLWRVHTKHGRVPTHL